MSKLLVIIGGPTASGKTEFAIKVATHFNTAILSADSRQFFRELSIGTAKPNTAELNAVKHYFINSHSIEETVTAGSYAVEARKILDELFRNKDVVVVAGGSGLYINALVNGVDEFPEIPENIRSGLHHQLAKEGIESLQKQLLVADPEYYPIVDIQNPQRIMRALEVFIASGKPYSSFLNKKNNPLNYPMLMFGLEWPRNELYERINSRVKQMIDSGLVDEVKSVANWRNQNALKTVGYKEIFEYLDGHITLEEAIELIAKNTRNYAKRQLTWFRRYPEMNWLKPEETERAIKIIQSQLDTATGLA